MDYPRSNEDYVRAFRHLREHGLLDEVLALVKERRDALELELRAELIEGELFEVDNKTRAHFLRLQGKTAALGELLTIMRTLAAPPKPAETELE